jgi:hypothetical protein
VNAYQTSAAPDRGADRKLTQPLGRAVRFTLVLAAVLLGIVLIFAVFGTVSLFGLGSCEALDCQPGDLLSWRKQD